MDRLRRDRPHDEISRWIAELSNDLDVERFLEMNASSLALTGVVMAILGRKKWLFLSAVVLGFLIRHSLQSWNPPGLRGDFSRQLRSRN